MDSISILWYIKLFCNFVFNLYPNLVIYWRKQDIINLNPLKKIPWLCINALLKKTIGSHLAGYGYINLMHLFKIMSGIFPRNFIKALKNCVASRKTMQPLFTVSVVLYCQRYCLLSSAIASILDRGGILIWDSYY